MPHGALLLCFKERVRGLRGRMVEEERGKIPLVSGNLLNRGGLTQPWKPPAKQQGEAV